MNGKGLKHSLFTDPQENEKVRKDVYNRSLIAVSLKPNQINDLGCRLSTDKHLEITVI